LIFKNLSRHLAAELDDVADLAAHYLDAIQHVQPRGPYVLGGHSVGGLVADEMGAHIVMLDTVNVTADIVREDLRLAASRG
jgi:thioesterase domain-containing protein